MTLTEYCRPLANLPVKAVDTDAVLRALTPLWTTRTETAKRLRGRIERGEIELGQGARLAGRRKSSPLERPPQ